MARFLGRATGEFSPNKKKNNEPQTMSEREQEQEQEQGLQLQAVFKRGPQTNRNAQNGDCQWQPVIGAGAGVGVGQLQ